jgi:hypothetical protein
MFCTRDEFDAYHRAHGEACDYDAMRSELGDRLFAADGGRSPITRPRSTTITVLTISAPP